jgi:dienelactone hydrolase
MKVFAVLMMMISMLSASSAQAGDPPIGTPDTVVVRNGSLTLRGLLWRPVGGGPFPAVLYNHGSGPQTDLTRPANLGPLFARHGYVVLYLFRRGAGLSANEGTDSEELMNRELAKNGQEGRNQVQLRLLDAELGDVRTGLTVLRARSEVDTSRIALVGYSFGGQLSLLVTEHDANIRAAVVFGAAAGSWETSKKLRDRLLAAVRRTTAPVFFIHAANDYSVLPGQALDAEMARAGRSHALKLYPAVGATPKEGHDFVHQRISTWEPDVFAFLDRYLRR